ncbi:MAG: iron-sulfur cluster assembly scaffold protein [Alphaproteobacteria bacterium]
MTDDLYQNAIVAHARAGAGKGRLKDPDGSATVDNPLCGDRVTIDLRMDGARVAALGQQVRGCVLCEAAASVIGQRAPGASRHDIAVAARIVAGILKGEPVRDAVSWPELSDFKPVSAYASRHDCVLLPFEALERALAAAAKPKSR